MSYKITRLAAAAAVLASGSLATVLAAAPAEAVSPPLTKVSVPVHFDLKSGQMPENVIPDRNGSVDVTLAGARQVARITSQGRIRVLATLPAPKDTKAKTPLLGFPLTTGLVRDGKTFYVAYATGTKAETGVWKFYAGQQPHKIADLPAQSLPNGMIMDRTTGTLYVTDSALGAVYSIATKGRTTVKTFSKDKALAPTGFFGVNGAKIRHGQLYVSNLDQGTVLRSPLRGAGTFTTVASGLQGIDDFAFTGSGNQLIAALITENKVVLVDRKTNKTILTSKDGLSNPSAVAVRNHTVYVTSAAYTTQKDPNLLVAHLAQR